MTLLAIIVTSFLPDDAPESEVMSPRWWNVGHIPAYALLTFFTTKVVSIKTKLTTPLIIGVGLAVAFFGLGIELLQPLVGRMSSAKDATLNAVGAGLGITAALLIYKNIIKNGGAGGSTTATLMRTTAPKTSADSAIIDELAPADEKKWDAFATSHERGTLYHRSDWRHLIHGLFGHETHYICAKRSPEEVVGILPLVRLQSRFFGDYLVSMPYFNYGGALAINPHIENALMKNACALAGDLGSQHIEFRDIVRRSGHWPVRTDKVIMELALPDSVEELWSRLGSKVRAQIKRPTKEGMKSGQGGKELLSDFYQVFSRNMRDLGTPVYAQDFFSAILDTFSENTTILVVRHQGQPVAAGFLLGFKDRLEIPWASSLRGYNPLGVNMLLYWEALKFAIDNDYRLFDFGRSSIDSGTYRFKKQWGAQPNQLYWYYWLKPGQQVPHLTPKNPKYRLAIAVWQRLPLFVTNWIGPNVVKYLP